MVESSLTCNRIGLLRNLTFLPYIVGERSPIMDARARGGFVGLALRHGPEHMARALLEGVAFALRQIIEAMEDCGASLPRLVASGNGLGSPLWRQMLADVIKRPLFQGEDAYASERAGVGAAMIGGIGAGLFKGYDDVRSLAPSFDVITAPNGDMFVAAQNQGAKVVFDDAAAFANANTLSELAELQFNPRLP